MSRARIAASPASVGLAPVAPGVVQPAAATQAAARVTVTCAGRGCRFARRTFSPGRIAALERRRPRPGARITVRVTQPGFIGTYTSIVVRRGQVPRRTDRCLRPGSTNASVCPAS